MADHQYIKLDQAEILYQNGLAKLSQPSTKTIWKTMFTLPIANVKQLQIETGLSPAAIRNSLNQLVQENLIFSNDRQRNKRYYLYDLIAIIKD